MGPVCTSLIRSYVRIGYILCPAFTTKRYDRCQVGSSSGRPAILNEDFRSYEFFLKITPRCRYCIEVARQCVFLTRSKSIKFSRAISQVKCLNGEKTNVSKTVSCPLPQGADIDIHPQGADVDIHSQGADVYIHPHGADIDIHPPQGADVDIHPSHGAHNGYPSSSGR